MKAILKSMLRIAVTLYIGLAILAFVRSDAMIFLPHPSSYRDGPEILKLASTNGNKISAVYLRGQMVDRSKLP